ncbi:UdgX family uracil-DNA binding protein [Nakamurella deserti]|uniref:UdgX family uracil-DNA binding protein n=1 Tax=Nakamurella deserti TaxID=2164074 RepID=UPI000DBE50AC|nr:UdgX family uracil-DNA binding protein [Nakamurella deserti]
MATAPTAAPFVPASLDLSTLESAASGCQGCELFADATRTVFGRGTAAARVMLVGEQPGDSEDREGEPFIGPAGRLLDGVLEEAGIDRSAVYVTNAVKHFRFTTTMDSPRRLHATPSTRHVNACRPWLAAELAAVAPRYVVALGATAAKSLLGPSFRVTQQHGELLSWPPAAGPFAAATLETADIAFALATIHPSAVLRARTPEDRDTSRAMMVADLTVLARAAAADG